MAQVVDGAQDEKLPPRPLPEDEIPKSEMLFLQRLL
jgi:hypothetical protein